MKTVNLRHLLLGAVRSTGKRAATMAVTVASTVAAKATARSVSLARKEWVKWKKPLETVRGKVRKTPFLSEGQRARWGSFFLFARECLRAPRSVGAICPSGPALAAAMAARVSQDDGLVVELGAGTGVVTAALLRRGIAPERLVVLERSEVMVELLRKRFPSLTVIHGDAALLNTYLPENAKVSCIVSSLPFVSIPDAIRNNIIDQIKHALRLGGCLLQYTYLWASESCLSRAGLTCVSSSTVWKNMPPARVMEFR